MKCSFPWAGLAAICLWTSCTARLPDARQFLENELLRARGSAKELYAKASAAYRRYEGQPQTEWHWRFRLQTAEGLVALGKLAAATELLEADVPTGIPAYTELRARQVMDRGSLYHNSDYARALQLYTESERSARENGLTELRAMALLRRGTAYFRLKRNKEAEADFRQAQRLGVQLNNPYLRSNALGSLGLLDMGDGRYDEAIDIFEEALAFTRGLHLNAFLAITQHNIGWCRFLLGDSEAALPLLESAERIAHEEGIATTEQLALSHIGEVYAFRRDDRTAASYYERALTLAREQHNDLVIGTLLTELTALAIRNGDTRRAEELLSEAAAMKDFDPENAQYLAISRGLLAQERGDPAQAIEQFQEVIDAPKSDLLRVRAGAELASTLLAMGRPTEAETQFRKVLADIEESRGKIRNPVSRISYFGLVGQAYQNYVTFLMDRRRETDALLVTEMSRARLLSDRVFLKTRWNPPDGAALRRLSSSEKTIFLSYWLGREHSLLWVVTPARIACFHLPGEGEIDRMVGAYRREIEDLQEPRQSDGELGKRLFATLVGPARELIPDGAKVVVVPDGELYNLNFETLITPDNRYWIEEVTLATAPSLNLLVNNRGSGGKREASVLLIGDPVSPDERQYPKLASTSREIESIERAFPAAARRSITGAQAVPAAYAASDPQRFSLIHFAAHATASREYPLESAVVLSRQGDTYKLYARDLIDHRIRAELVTISACRSAGARTYAGEGLVGFVWAFLQAGAHNVIGGLWEVDDQSTARIMKDLYAGLRQGMSPAVALRNAKLQIVSARGPMRKPYYWAPFQVYLGRF